MGRPGLWEGGGGKIPFHLFPAPGDENRDHYSDDLLFRAFVCFGLFFFLTSQKEPCKVFKFLAD